MYFSDAGMDCVWITSLNNVFKASFLIFLSFYCFTIDQLGFSNM